MEEQKLTNLIRKFLAGEVNDSEKKELNDWYSLQNEKVGVWEADSEREENEVEARMLQHINKHVHSKKAKVVFLNKRFILRIAAVFIGFLLCTGLYFYTLTHNHRQEKLVSASIIAPVKLSENKYVTLPDSSVVVLQAGSKIQYSFNGKERRLSLVGEAYFDIKHLTDQPFVIRTGDVVTTVLGTAFNIKAFPGENITISVTRGKVSVEDRNKKMLAILLPNQQVIYNGVEKSTSLQKIKTTDVINWTKSDMQLDDISFKQAAERLSRRYAVEVKFKNPDLERCLIHGQFDGTESLKQVLDVLTYTTGSVYSIEKQTVIVDGKACQ